jgi:hypothetical protein
MLLALPPPLPAVEVKDNFETAVLFDHLTG